MEKYHNSLVAEGGYVSPMLKRQKYFQVVKFRLKKIDGIVKFKNL